MSDSIALDVARVVTVKSFRHGRRSGLGGAAPRGVVIADDHAGMREALRLALDAHPELEVIGEASDGAEAVQWATFAQPAVIVLDVHMPVLDGIAALPYLRHAAPRARIVMFSADIDSWWHDAALAAGAHVCVNKTTRLDIVEVVLAELRRAGNSMAAED